MAWILAIGCRPCLTLAADLVNPGFEQVAKTGAPVGWTVLTDLDPHGYGEPRYDKRFDAVRPTVGARGYASERCLAFPAEGVWHCPVFRHSSGDGKGVNGKALGKAAVYQSVELAAGRYRVSAMMRTAEGDLYAGAFSLGVNLGPPAANAHDGSTGIRWKHNLATRSALLGGVSERGEWSLRHSDPFELSRPGPVTIWIRFDYANENQMNARWQVDDVAIVSADAADDGAGASASKHAPCRPPQVARSRVCPPYLESQLAEAGRSLLVKAEDYRLFRQARQLPPGTDVRYEFPTAGDASHVLVSAIGKLQVDVGDTQFEMVGQAGRWPTTREWPLPATKKDAARRVTVRATGSEPALIYEIELSRPSRTALRLLYVAADTVAVPWVIGSWDASANEFTGAETAMSDPSTGDPTRLSPKGRWELHFRHRPVAGHRYYLVHGLLEGKGSIDVHGDGLVDWIAETKGEEIVDFEVTDLLRPGDNMVRIEASGGHDFAALIEVCPGSADLGSLRLSFAGDEQAELFTRVIDNTWFWLRELHYEPSGFIDASVPRGKWYSQYWPVDIAFALREWVRWGYQDESVLTGLLVSGGGWHGHQSNLSGGSDNTGGNILVLQLCEILRRAEGGLSDERMKPIWDRIREHCREVVEEAAKAPYGLIRGTNWENAGNREHGPCYALSTNLGAAAALRKAAVLAEDRGERDDADRWRRAAVDLRAAVLKHLVLRKDHRCPSGFVLPKDTWAYGLRMDGTIEDQPLAGYFWAGADLLDFEGLIAKDRELLAVYERTLQAALPLFDRQHTGTVSGYAASYDGPQQGLILAALCDRIDDFGHLLRQLLRETDVARDVGSQHAELSRWAYGAPNDAEDTNLVCAAGFLWGLRVLPGIDDLLADAGQLRLVPRLPWAWSRVAVKEWPVRYRAVEGKPAWTRLSFRLEREDRRATLRLTTTQVVRGLKARLGPFKKGVGEVDVVQDGASRRVETETSGDASWVWVSCDSGPGETVIDVRAR